MISSKAAKQYASVNAQSSIEDASPHRLIQMLFEGALDNLVKTKGAIERRDFATKAETLGRTITIVGGLQASLDKEKGGDVADNLDKLYDYMTVRLYDATLTNDTSILEEVHALIRTVKEGWDGIEAEANALSTNKTP